jgi:hypothetical protein
MGDNTDYAGTDDTDLRDRQERDRLLRRARDSDRREPRRRIRDRGGRLSDNVQSADRVADRVANDVNALVRAWSASNAEAFKGIVTIVGNIALDLVGDARPRRSAAYDDDDRDEDDDRGTRPRGYADDDDDDDDYRRTPRQGRRRDAVGDVGGDVADVTHSLSDAFAEAASVTARSSRRFQDEFDAALDESAELDDSVGRRDTNPRPAKRGRGRRDRQPDRSRDQADQRDAEDTIGEAGARVGAAVDDLAGRQR